MSFNICINTSKAQTSANQKRRAKNERDAMRFKFAKISSQKTTSYVDCYGKRVKIPINLKSLRRLFPNTYRNEVAIIDEDEN